MSNNLGVTLKDGTEIELSTRGTTGYKGIIRWTGGRGQAYFDFEAGISLDDDAIANLDPRIYDLPAGARMGKLDGRRQLSVGGENDVRKAAYRRGYFINNSKSILNDFFSEFPNPRYQDWMKYEFVPSFPEDLFELPNNSKLAIDLAQRLKQEREDRTPKDNKIRTPRQDNVEIELNKRIENIRNDPNNPVMKAYNASKHIPKVKVDTQNTIKKGIINGLSDEEISSLILQLKEEHELMESLNGSRMAPKKYSILKRINILSESSRLLNRIRVLSGLKK